MKSSPPGKSKNVGLIVLSAIDVITGILSLIITAIAVQVIAVMSSGLTLVKAIKVAVQSEKTAILVKPVAVYAVRKITRSEKMKSFFGKIKDNLKNNPITLVTAIVEFLACEGAGYLSLDFVDRFSWAVGWKAYLLAFGAATLIYGIIVTMTVYLGHDSAAFAAIRKFVKLLGGESAVAALDKANNEMIAKEKEEKERIDAENEAARIAKEAEAKKKAEEEAILQYALEQEAIKKAEAEEERRKQLLNAYSAEFHKKQMEAAVNVPNEANSVTEVINNAGSYKF